MDGTTRERRAAAQRWFSEPGRRRVSRTYDDRETAASRWLCLEVALAQLGREPARVLDVGCGDGDGLVLAARRCPEAALTGLDPEPVEPPAELAGRDVAVVGGSAEAPPEAVSARGPFDLVLAHLCWALWPDPEAGLRATADLLAPAGLLYVVDVDGAPEAAPALLQTARDEDERAYLIDQHAASLRADEAAAIAARLGPGLRADVTRGGLGGRALGSPEALDLLGRAGVREALDAFPPGPAGLEDTVYHLRVRRD